MDPLFYKSPLLRYYTAYTYQFQNEVPLLVRMHSNKLFLLFLHPSHPAMNQHIQKVEYKHSNDSLSGKRKRGAINLQFNTHLLEIKTESDNFLIRAGVPGKLIEVNELFDDNPNLIKSQEGFLAIVMPPLNKIDSILGTLNRIDKI